MTADPKGRENKFLWGRYDEGHLDPAEEVLKALEPIGHFLHDLNGTLYFYRLADGTLYPVKSDPRSAFYRFVLGFVGSRLAVSKGTTLSETIEALILWCDCERVPLLLDLPRPDGTRHSVPVRSIKKKRKHIVRRSARHTTKHKRVSR